MLPGCFTCSIMAKGCLWAAGLLLSCSAAEQARRPAAPKVTVVVGTPAKRFYVRKAGGGWPVF